MIELEDTESEFEVEVCAVVGVKRTVRVKALGEGHAREVAKLLVRAEASPQTWTSLGGEAVVIDPDNITQLLTGMCPKRL